MVTISIFSAVHAFGRGSAETSPHSRSSSLAAKGVRICIVIEREDVVFIRMDEYVRLGIS